MCSAHGISPPNTTDHAIMYVYRMESSSLGVYTNVNRGVHIHFYVATYRNLDDPFNFYRNIFRSFPLGFARVICRMACVAASKRHHNDKTISFGSESEMQFCRNPQHSAIHFLQAIVT